MPNFWWNLNSKNGCEGWSDGMSDGMEVGVGVGLTVGPSQELMVVLGVRAVEVR